MSNQLYPYELLERLGSFWQLCFKSDRKAQNYLKKRGVTLEVADKFGLGYSNWSSSPRPAVCSKTIKEEVELYRALGLESKNGGDKFHNRIMVPFQNLEGELVGFSGRLIENYSGDDPRSRIHKYLRTRFTEGQNKDVAPLLWHGSRGAIDESKEMIVVEGIFDALTLQSAGFRNAVAIQGSDTQIDGCFFAEQATKGVKVVMMFDADKAGERARLACLSKIVPELVGEAEFFYANIPYGFKDVGEVFEKKKDAGTELVQKEIFKAGTIQDEVARYIGGDEIPVEERAKAFSHLSLIIQSVDSHNTAVIKMEETIREKLGIDLSQIRPIPGKETGMDLDVGR